MIALLAALALLVAHPQTGASGDFLAFAQTPRRPGNLLGRTGVVGHSVQGRPIEVRQVGDPKWPGKLLVFGCIHGDECGASSLEPPINGCPDPSADIFLVPTLNPDGSAAALAAERRRRRPQPQLSLGLAAGRPAGRPRIPRPAAVLGAGNAPRRPHRPRARPAATVWFHQYRGERPFVRAWGQSVAGARHFAALAGMPFRLMRWPAGTGAELAEPPLPGRRPFVVELPQGKLSPMMRGGWARHWCGWGAG